MAKYSAASGLTGALGGAATGAQLGSIVPGIGTAIGAVGGGLIGGVAGLFGSKKKKTKKPKQLSTFDPMQQQLYQQYMQSLTGNGPFSDLYNFNAEQANQAFDANVSRPAYRSFRENVIPQITGQFRQGNLMNSSYAGDALSRAGRDVQENLDAQRSAMQFQGQQQSQASKQNAINSLLNTQSFAYSKPGEQKPSTIDQILNSVAPSAGEWFADYLRPKNNQYASGPGNPNYSPNSGYVIPSTSVMP